MAESPEQQQASDLMRALKLRAPASVSWDGRNLIVDPAGQVLPERPTNWRGHEVVYRPSGAIGAPPIEKA